MAERSELSKALGIAISEGKIDQVRELLAQHGKALNKVICVGGDGLFTAASHGRLDMVKLFLSKEYEFDVNSKETFPPHQSPLEACLKNCDPDVVLLLLEHGADPNYGRAIIGAISGYPPKKNSLEIVKLLEKHGADLHRTFVNHQAKDKDLMNALSTAIAWGQQEVADYLRSRGAVLPDKTPRKPAGDGSADSWRTNEIVAYFEKKFGPVDPKTLIEIVPTEPAIAIHVIPPSAGRSCVTLFTTGMSAERMKVPPGGEAFQLAELFVQLPADWPYMAIDDPAHGWPIHRLRSTAKYPRQNDTWLGGQATIVADAEPPEPITPGSPFTSLLFLAEEDLTTEDGRSIVFYRMTPLYTEERELEMRKGLPKLMRAFDRNKVSFVVDLKRPNVALKRGWFW
jgi:hypothetical protein